jgi:hypothetical protein
VRDVDLETPEKGAGKELVPQSRFSYKSCVELFLILITIALEGRMMERV